MKFRRSRCQRIRESDWLGRIPTTSESRDREAVHRRLLALSMWLQSASVCGVLAPILYATTTNGPPTKPPPALSGYSKFCVVLSSWTISRVRRDNQADRPTSMADISTTLRRLIKASPVYPDMESWPTPLHTYPEFLHVSSIRRIS